MVIRVGQTPDPQEDKNPRVLTGPAPLVSSRGIRPRAVRMNHLGPDVRDAIDAGGVEEDSNSDGNWWMVGTLLVCTHRLTGLSSGEEEWTFPAEFSSAPRVSATPLVGTARFATVQLVTATEAEIRCWDDSGATSDADVDVIAIGEAA